ncbi:dapper homolog 3 [Colossoma macropomum]|uniref:dapper homolog 3 n=1 Tax=Colossoma macropomum TaxID=42526 RepID=UPI0018651BAC|nr:dapper homolog 3 [Colossoma macropomum]
MRFKGMSGAIRQLRFIWRTADQLSGGARFSGFGGAFRSRDAFSGSAEAKTDRGGLQLLLSGGSRRAGGGEGEGGGRGGEFSFMHRGISLHMPAERSRNKELLEASVAWLWELEELRERQHNLVLTALSLGGPPAGGELEPEPGGCVDPEEWAFRRRLDRLQDAPSGLMQVLQQQFSELRVDTCDQSAEDDLDSPSSSGFYEQSETQSPPRRSSSSPSLSFPSHRPRSVDAYMWDWESQREPTPRTVLPRSFSAPYPPLEGIAEGTEEEEDDDEDVDNEDGALWSEGQVVNGDPLNRHEMGLTVEVNEGPDGEVNVGPTVDIDGPTEETDEGPVEEVDEGPTAEDIQQAMRVEAYILGLLQRCSLNPNPSPSADLDFTSNRWQDLHSYPPVTNNYCDPTPGHSEWQEWAALNEEEDGGEESQEGYYMPPLDPQDGPASLVCEDPESSLEMEQYGAMKPCTSSSDGDSLQHQRGYLEHHATVLDPMSSSHYIRTRISPPATLESAEQDWTPRLPRMHQEERWGSVEERRGKTTSRSQSEGSFPPQGWTVQPEHRYYTVGRDRGTHCIDEDYLSNQRLWCSSADLSQEEEESSLRGEEPMLKYTSLPFHTFPQYTEQSQHLRNGTNARASRGEGSDSSLSETCSPRSSSVSSDSDESGGLVWPQQLPPRLPASSQNAQSSVVKIKASHALKRKIMRFRSGSLKVMTTV